MLLKGKPMTHPFENRNPKLGLRLSPRLATFGLSAALLAFTAASTVSAQGVSPAGVAESSDSTSPRVQGASKAADSSSQPKPLEGPNTSTFMGFGLGLVFSSIPVSTAEFVAPFSHLYYSWYLTDPNDSFRTAASLGVYGFGVFLPVPKVSAEMFLGKPTQDIQGKLGVGGFYDFAVGGHGGLALEAGIRLANKYDISVVTVPTGSPAKRDYLEFMGVHDEPGKKPWVKVPYFGVFLSVIF